MRDLSHTLYSRRSTLTYRSFLTGETTQDAIANIDSLLASDNSDALSKRYPEVSVPNLLGVFTGQGAQWPRMGAYLILRSPFVMARLAELDAALASLPEADRPDWTLQEQLLASKEISRLSEAAISQPLCTAVQIVLVDLLAAANLKFQAVVGHSSGEIGCAYAAGFLSGDDAIRVAYYRGLYAKLARSPDEIGTRGAKGAMLAVGTSFSDAQEFCALEEFGGRIQIAAENSPTSVTLSGDEDIIEEALAVFQDEGKFARKLMVDTAYHSRHMQACSGPYLDALTRCNIQVNKGNGVTWLSSVNEGQVVTAEHLRDQMYWINNMKNPVLFARAVAAAAEKQGPFDLAVEIGAHPALKTPCLDSLRAEGSTVSAYTGLLARGKNDVLELAKCLGQVWSYLGPSSVDFVGFENVISGSKTAPATLTGLPNYPFDHSRSFYQLSRYSGGHLVAQEAPNPLLGRRIVESETTAQVSWRNILSLSEVSWLTGHALQGQTVFPAMGYVAMAVEAIAAIAGTMRPLGLIAIQDVTIGRALAWNDSGSKVETRVVVNVETLTETELTGQFCCYSGLPHSSTAPFAPNFSAKISVAFHEARADTLPPAREEEINLNPIDVSRLYEQFTELGYNYSSPFTGVTSISRKNGYATGMIEDFSGDSWEDQVLIHPGWLDSALQTSFAAYSCPQDNRLWTLHVPTAIRSVLINPSFTARDNHRRFKNFTYQTVAIDAPTGVVADIDIFPTQDSDYPFIQIEGVEVKPFAPGSAAQDASIFSSFDYRVASPDGAVALAQEHYMTPERTEILKASERVGFYYIRNLYETLTPDEKANALPHYKRFLEFAERIVGMVSKGQLPNVPPEACKDTRGFVRSLMAKHQDVVDIQLLEAAGENLVLEVRRSGSILEHVLKDGLLDRFYEESAALNYNNVLIGRVIGQIAHRYPGLRIFEVGAGTGGSTSQVLPAVGSALSSYTYTDISAGFFSRVKDRFRKYADRMIFATFDMAKSASEQGFEEGTYDVVVASNVLHATGQLDTMIGNVRKLLRPGGFLVMLELLSNYSLGIDAVMGALPGWWEGAEVESWRRDGPSLNLDQWTELTRRHGFAGVNTHTSSSNPLQAFSVVVCQAINPLITALNDPLAATTHLSSNKLQQLLVVGGNIASTCKTVLKAIEIARERYAKVTHLRSLEELNKVGLEQESTVLCLTELDEQYLEQRSNSKIEALKVLWRDARNVLWVTRGARDDSPYSAMMLGLCRTIRFENPHLNLQVLDFDVTPSAESLVESLIRLELGVEAKDSDSNALWEIEPEIHIVNNRALVPRLYPHSSANNRYNSSRRTVKEEVDITKSVVELGIAPDARIGEVRLASPFSSKRGNSTIDVEVHLSVQPAIKIEGAYFHLCVGKDVKSGDSIIAASQESVRSTMQVPGAWTKILPQSIASPDLHILVYSMIAQSIIHHTKPDDVVLVHNANGHLCKAIRTEAAAHDVSFTFTTSIQPSASFKSHESAIFLHENLPRRIIEKVIPQDTTTVIDMTSATKSIFEGLWTKVRLPQVKMLHASDFVSHFFKSPAVIPDTSKIQDILDLSCRSITRASRRNTVSGDLLSSISLEDVQNPEKSEAGNSLFNVVDWKSSTHVSAVLQNIDVGTVFRNDGTYWLVGLAGDMGRSFCHWMVHHGARHIVLSSRNPKLHPSSFKSLEAFGADIKVIKADVTIRKSLREAYDKINAEMPPIIGVANGAMILEDSLFNDVQYESIERTMPPKVDGSVYLDELFYSEPLDFFILFTSVANVIGSSGQSTYVMANSFMSALAKQRRDVRGVAGSDIAIGSVQGLGYLSREENLGKDYFVRRGYRNLSEQDIHQLFAEAILAGQPGCKESSQVVTGIQPFREAHAQLMTDAKFRHMRIREDAIGSAGHNVGSENAVKPRSRLAVAKSREEAVDIIQEAFITRLRSVLMMPSSQVIDPLASLMELGTDSIMAVDIRAWFLKELDVDIPVLKILGPGETVIGLVEDSLGKVSPTIFDLNKVNDEERPSENPPIKLTIASTSSSSETGSQLPRTSQSSPSSVNSVSEATLETPLQTPLETPAECPKQIGSLSGTGRRLAIMASSTEHVEQMTFGQSRFWFLQHYVEDPTTFNIAYFAKLRGPIRVSQLARAIENVAQRHEALRTRFFWSEDNARTPMQGISSKPLVQLETGSINTEAQAHQALEDMRNHTWDMSDWIPLRILLLSLSDTEHFLIIGTHHISMDGHSFSILMLDIQKAYYSPNQRLPPLATASQPRVLGAKLRQALRSDKMRDSLDYYRQMFSGFDLAKPIELFSFAKTQIRPPLDAWDTHIVKVQLDATTTSKLKQLSQQQSATKFHTYLAALQTLVFRLLPPDNTDQIVIGVSDANRLDASSLQAIGNLLNILPICLDRPSQGQRFDDVVRNVQKQSHMALKHSALPFDVLLDELHVPRSSSWAPMLQIYLEYRLVVKEQAEKNWLECKIEEENWHTAKNGYDVLVEITDHLEGANIAVHAQKALYSAAAAKLIGTSYAYLLKQLSERGFALDTTRDLKKWHPADINAAIAAGRGPNIPSRWGETVLGGVDKTVSDYPENVAIKDGYGQALTYRAMDMRIEAISDSLKQHLPERPANGEQHIVGLFQLPTVDNICSILAIFRLGAIYLPLDPANGTARLRSNVRIARPAVVLIDRQTRIRLSEIDENDGFKTVNVSEVQTSSSTSNDKKLYPSAESTAYILFSSGSTGEPKGIVVKHGGLRGYLEGSHNAFDMRKYAEVVLQMSAFSFDMSLIQMFAALCTGGCLIVVPADSRGDPTEVATIMLKHGVTMTAATPSEYDMWFRFAPDLLHQCKTWNAAWWSGENATLSLFDNFRGLCNSIPDLRVVNCYGATEISCAGIESEADLRHTTLETVATSRPLPNIGCYIVDEELKPQPLGVPGELIVAGVGISSNNYLGRPDLTEEKFPKDTIGGPDRVGWDRMYRTGDRGWLDENGNLFVQGRIAGDTQVKLRGFRIELMEIESVMIKEAAGALTHAIVTLRGDFDGGQFLVGHIVLRQGAKEVAKDLISHLKSRLALVLPPYMCPAMIFAIPQMPLSSHGKVDRRLVGALELPTTDISTTHQLDHLSSTERRLAALWSSLFPYTAMVDEINREANFFESGGNSLLLVKLQTLIKQEFHDAPRLTTLMRTPILGPMASLLDDMNQVDWDAEIALPSDQITSASITPSKQETDELVILLTGGTGSLGRRVLKNLVANTRIRKIICLVRNLEGRDLDRLFHSLGSTKIEILETELPSLPSDDVLVDVDRILHCAAERNFWDGYSVVRGINTDTAKALADLSIRIGAALHVLSSGALVSYESEDGEGKSLPRPAAQNGYISSKWVAERYLARISRKTSTSITVHRPTHFVSSEAKHNEPSEVTIARDIISISRQLGSQPDFSALDGTIDIVRLDSIADKVAREVTGSLSPEASNLVVVNHPGAFRISIQTLSRNVKQLLEQSDNASVAELPKKSALYWVGDAKDADLFEWFFTSQELTMYDENGRQVQVSR